MVKKKLNILQMVVKTMQYISAKKSHATFIFSGGMIKIHNIQFHASHCHFQVMCNAKPQL